MRLPPFCKALLAFASAALEKQREIVPAVVVGDLLARRDVPDRAQDHLALAKVGFGVRTAGMVGVARDVAAVRAVDRRAAVDLEHVAGAARLPSLGLGMPDAASAVFDDERALRDRRGRKQAEAGAGAADAIASSATRPARHVVRRYAAFSFVRVTASVVSTGTGSRSVLMPGQPSSASRSTCLSFSSGASLMTLIEIVTFWKPGLGAPGIMWPRASKSVRATASKLS